jgi:hypothetical protein
MMTMALVFPRLSPRIFTCRSASASALKWSYADVLCKTEFVHPYIHRSNSFSMDEENMVLDQLSDISNLLRLISVYPPSMYTHP